MFGRPRLQKIARAVLMSLPAILLLVVGILQIKDAIGGSNLVKQALPQDSGSNPFSCVGAADVTCVIFQGYIFIPVIVGVFVLVEVLVTLLRGPLHEKGYF
ncbi:hypothetical protein EC991_007352 [Linnemannia zychae]|nr:hypothetical protein EC991_007352 [Linnemannia zychae]